MTDGLRGPLWMIAGALMLIALSVAREDLTSFGKFGIGLAAFLFVIHGAVTELSYTWRRSAD